MGVIGAGPAFVRTKLHRPRVTAGLVPLVRAQQALGANLDRPLTLISAPAGFGKTTLLSAWLAECPRPGAWLSLDENDSHPTTFLNYLITAIRTIFPEACPETAILLHAEQMPPLALLSATLINDIDTLADAGPLTGGQRFILALDDYYQIRGQAVHQLLNDLLAHPPRPLHLALATRYNPPLNLMPLRANDQVVEIRSAGLRFTSSEAAAFFRQAIRYPIDPETVALVWRRTEGWAAGLRFVSLLLNARRDDDRPFLEVVGDNQLAMDYLLNEVLARLPAATQEFLIRTSLVERLSGPLGDALLGDAAPPGSSLRQLEWLEQQDAFTVALDDQGEWYRYHWLFRTLLQKQLEHRCKPATIADLHRRASQWYAANGFVEDAVQHALAAGDELLVAQLVEQHRHATLSQEQWPVLERWLALLPRRLVDHRPELLLLEAWVMQQHWRFAEFTTQLDRVATLLDQEPLPEPQATRVHGELDLLRSRLHYYASDAEGALTLARRALEKVPLEYHAERALSWMTYASALQLKGDLRGAEDALYDGLKEGRLHPSPFPSVLFLTICHLRWMAADLAAVQLGSSQLLKLGADQNLLDSLAWGRYFRGCAAYQLNDLAGAEQAFAEVAGRPYLAPSFAYAQSAFGLASVYLAQGDCERAQAVTESVVAYGWETSSGHILNEANAFQAYLALRQGQRARARHWAASTKRDEWLTPQAPFHESGTTRVKILLDEATPESLAEAADYLERLHGFAIATHNALYEIQVCALKTWLHAQTGEESADLACLKTAVLLAEPGGVLRVFIDLINLYTPIARLLTVLAGQGVARDFIAQVLRAAPRGPAHPAAAAGDGGSNGPKPLIKPLTRREREVLQLLAQHLTAHEIAEKLVISEATAKRHTANIYLKLGVKRRKDALHAARAAGLLPDD